MHAGLPAMGKTAFSLYHLQWSTALQSVHVLGREARLLQPPSPPLLLTPHKKNIAQLNSATHHKSPRAPQSVIGLMKKHQDVK